MQERHYLVLKPGAESTTVTIAKLKELAATGEISHDDRICEVETGKKCKAHRIQGLVFAAPIDCSSPSRNSELKTAPASAPASPAENSAPGATGDRVVAARTLLDGIVTRALAVTRWALAELIQIGRAMVGVAIRSALAGYFGIQSLLAKQRQKQSETEHFQSQFARQRAAILPNDYKERMRIAVGALAAVLLIVLVVRRDTSSVAIVDARGPAPLPNMLAYAPGTLVNANRNSRAGRAGAPPTNSVPSAPSPNAKASTLAPRPFSDARPSGFEMQKFLRSGGSLVDFNRQNAEVLIARSPADPQGYIDLAYVNLSYDIPAAIAAMDRAIANTPPDVRLHLTRGEFHGRAHNWAAAERDFTQSRKMAPEMPAPLVGLATVKLYEGDEPDYAAATALLNQALQLDPKDVSALTYLGKCAIDTKDYERGEAILKQAIALDPQGAKMARQVLNDFSEMRWMNIMGMAEQGRNEMRQAAAKAVNDTNREMSQYQQDMAGKLGAKGIFMERSK